MRLLVTFLLIIFSTINYFSAAQEKSEVIKRSAYYQVDGNKLHCIDSVYIQINERAGDEAADISIDYSKGDKLSIGDAWIEDNLGNIVRKLKKSEIEDRSAISSISLYEDDFVKEFSLKHNTYPYRVFYTYKKTTSKFITIHRFFSYGTPYNEININVESPEKQPIVYRQKNINEPGITTTNGKIFYTWQFSNKGYKPEINALYKACDDFPELEIGLLNFDFGVKGSAESWQTYGNWYYRLNEGRDILPESEQQKVTSLLNGIENKRDKARILYNYLQDNTRYINVSINYGGLQTYPASYVCINRYGDCKALSNYMKAMLSYAGIESYMTLVYSGKRREVHRDFPASYFNHAILSIPFDKDTVYLDCTTKNYPFGYIHENIQGQDVLIVKAEGSHISTIPVWKSEDVLCTRKIELDCFQGDLTAYSKERGKNYELFNYVNSSIDKNTVDKYIRNTVFKNSAFNLQNHEITNVSRDSVYVEINFSGQIKNAYKEYGNNVVLSPFSFSIPTYELPKDRKYGVQLNCPRYGRDTIIYHIGKEIKKTPEDISVISPYGTYILKFETDGDKLVVNKSYQIFSGEYPIEQYSEFYNFISKIRSNESKNIYLEVL